MDCLDEAIISRRCLLFPLYRSHCLDKNVDNVEEIAVTTSWEFLDPAINKTVAKRVSYSASLEDNTGRSSSRSSSRRLNRGINYKRWPGQDVAHAKGRLL